MFAFVLSNIQVNWSNVDHEIARLIISFVTKRAAKTHRRLLLDCLWFVMYFNFITAWIRGISNHEFIKLYVTRKWVFIKFKVICEIEFSCKFQGIELAIFQAIICQDLLLANLVLFQLSQLKIFWVKTYKLELSAFINSAYESLL